MENASVQFGIARDEAAALDGYFSRMLGAQLPWLAEALLFAAATYLALIVLTALNFARHHRFKIPGPWFVTPLIGGIITMVRDPYTFWQRQLEYSPHGVSWTSILSHYMVFATRSDLCHRIFESNSPETLTLELHPNGRMILGNDNIAFMTGPVHKALRASFLNLFTTKALSLYLVVQEKFIRKNLSEWLKLGAPVEMRDHIRDMNMVTSQTVFIGQWLADPVAFKQHYNAMTAGFLTAPIYFPGTALYKAIAGRKKVVELLTDAVARSKTHMSTPGAEATCLLDFWSSHILELTAQATATGEKPPPFAENHHMAHVMMDFLFASQDASTASLVTLTATMAERPEIRARVAEEQRRLRPNNEPLTYEVVQSMTFTRACVLEQLRLQPPAPMVPMIAHCDFALTSDLVVPKGSVIIPSLVGSCREGFPNADTYDPDRMGPERREDRTFSKQFIPFGVGPHKCVGYNYAIQHLTAYLAILAAESLWTRTRTPDSDKIVYLPTLYPADCIMAWTPRSNDV